MKKALSVRASFLGRVVGGVIVALVALLPLLYFPGRIAAAVTSKQYFLIGIVDVLVVLWAWLLLREPAYRLRKATLRALLPAGVFVLALTVSSVLGASPARSFFSTVESGTGLITLLHIIALMGVVASVVSLRGHVFVKRLMTAVVVGGGILATATWCTGVNGYFDIHSMMLNNSNGGATMGNVLLAGAYLIFALFFALYLLVHASTRRAQVWYAIGAVGIVGSPVFVNVTKHLWLGNARTATVALVIGLVVSLCIWLALHPQGTNRRRLGRAGIAAIIVGGVWLTASLFAPLTSVHRFFVAQSGNRVTDWQESLQGIKARPILGWGAENFPVVYQRYLDPVVFNPGHGNEVWALHPHNNTLEVLVDGGVVGALAYLWMVGSLFALLVTLRKKGSLSNAGFALLVGMLVAFILQQQMIYDSIASEAMFFIIIGMAAGFATPASEAVHSRLSVQKTLAAIGVLILMIPIWTLAAYLPARKMEEVKKIVAMPSDVRAKTYQHVFHSAGSYAINTDAEFFLEPLFYSYAGKQEEIKANDRYRTVATSELQSLFAAVAPVWEHNPYDYHLTLTLLQLENLYYYLSADPHALKRADIYAEHAALLSPTDPQLYINYAQTLIYEQNITGVRAALQKARSLNAYYTSQFDAMLVPYDHQ